MHKLHASQKCDFFVVVVVVVRFRHLLAVMQALDATEISGSWGDRLRAGQLLLEGVRY